MDLAIPDAATKKAMILKMTVLHMIVGFLTALHYAVGAYFLKLAQQKDSRLPIVPPNTEHPTTSYQLAVPWSVFIFIAAAITNLYSLISFALKRAGKFDIASQRNIWIVSVIALVFLFAMVVEQAIIATQYTYLISLTSGLSSFSSQFQTFYILVMIDTCVTFVLGIPAMTYIVLFRSNRLNTAYIRQSLAAGYETERNIVKPT